MTQYQFEVFCKFREDFKNQVKIWAGAFPQLLELQKDAAVAGKTPLYSFETPVVYNTDLDKITIEDEIKLIVIGDNPGKDEQLLINNRYLVGQAGKIAAGYFKKNPELGVDFRKNVIILNKTPVHSAKTNQLKHIVKHGGSEVEKLVLESQLWMAEHTAKLHSELCKDQNGPELWMVGYSELKNKGIFIPYKEQLKKTYQKISGAWDKVFVFQHFSMNRFIIDLADYLKANPQKQSLSLLEQFHSLGTVHKEEIFA